MDNGYAIEVKDISKHFKIYADKSTTAKEKILFWKRNRYEKKQVLNDISFTIRKGESVGLIGHNGCGKSTTLKILTRIMYPDSGTVTIHGRVSSLLELGAGFHPDMTGVENIYINASIFGLGKKEIDSKLKDIIEFAELGEYINNPVRTYSSGMYMRLAFAVAINVNADILLIDEVLAVGDVNFQAKCINKLMEMKRTGVTIVLVSHSTDQIESICDRSIWIHDGKIQADGPCRDIHRLYLRYMGEKRADNQENEEKSETPENRTISDGQTAEKIQDEGEKPVQRILQDRGDDVRYKDRMRGNGDAKILYINSYDSTGNIRNVFESGETVTFRIKYKLYKKTSEAFLGLCIFRNDGFRCYGTNTKIDNLKMELTEENGEFSIEFPNMELLQGKYYVDVCIASREDDMLDYLDGVNAFEIYNTTGEIGLSRIPYLWDIEHAR